MPTINPQSSQELPLLLDIQTNLLGHLHPTVVVPLEKLEGNKDKVLSQLTPTLNIAGIDYLMLTPQLAGTQRKQLGRAIVSVEHARIEILNALDFLLKGI